MGISCAIHVNPNLRHQVDYGAAIKAGLGKNNIEAWVTPTRSENADFHVAIGPWWAKDALKGRQVLYFDRAFWDDPRAVSVSWLDELGNKQYVFKAHSRQRPHPTLKPAKDGNKVVILCDYGQDGREFLSDFPSATIRRHPAESPESQSLAECLQAHDIAVGGHSTAMVEAAIAGLRVISTVPTGPCAGLKRSRARWINALAWHNWYYNEIEDGTACRYLLRLNKQLNLPPAL